MTILVGFDVSVVMEWSWTGAGQRMAIDVKHLISYSDNDTGAPDTWPWESSPQHWISPPSDTAQVKAEPADTEEKDPDGVPETSPDHSSPQQWILPSSSRAHACSFPQVTEVNTPAGASDTW